MAFAGCVLGPYGEVEAAVVNQGGAVVTDGNYGPMGADVLAQQAVLQFVEDVEGEPPKRQPLVYASKQLVDGRALFDDYIQKEPALRMVLRLLGGLQIFVEVKAQGQRLVFAGKRLEGGRAQLQTWRPNSVGA